MVPTREGRKIVGAAAILLPFDDGHTIDWSGLAKLVERTVRAGLIPAVNMDTGYVQLLSSDEQARVLKTTAAVAEEFFAGVYVADTRGDLFDCDAYSRAFGQAVKAGATPVIFPSWGLNDQHGDDWVASLTAIADGAEFIGFELGSPFVPYGKIFDSDTYVELMKVPNCIGAKHSSLSRDLEWERLRLRDERRPDFRVFTGNDLAIDMVMYGSDYLLGLAAAAPDAFAVRDALWAKKDQDFHELNDLLQYLGAFGFRAPVPAYKHSVAEFLRLRGWISSSNTHPDAPTRPKWETDVLAEIAERLAAWLGDR